MIRKFWIWFYAFALGVLVLLFVAVTSLAVGAFEINHRSWLWLPPILFGPAWLVWVAWRLLRREIARGKIGD
jgi:threonine/homoserine/homoserine lactone efflux protein